MKYISPIRYMAVFIFCLSLLIGQANATSISVFDIKRDTGITSDVYPVAEMTIDFVTGRVISQVEMQQRIQDLIQRDDIASWDAAQFLDDLLGAYGVPTERKFVTSTSLASEIIQSIDSGLPIILSSYDRQVLISGYLTDPFRVYVHDPVGTSDWSTLTALTIDSYGIVVREVITVPPFITINTAGYGTLTYNVASGNFSSGSPPANDLYRTIIASMLPYAQDDLKVNIINYGLSSTNLGLYAVFVKNSVNNADAFIEELLRSWEAGAFLDDYQAFVFPMDTSGYLDLDELAIRTNELSVLYRAFPSAPNLQSQAWFQARFDLEAKFQMFRLRCHPYGYDKQLLYTDTLRMIVQQPSSYTAEDLADADMHYQGWKEALWEIAIEQGLVSASLGDPVEAGFEVTAAFLEGITPEMMQTVAARVFLRWPGNQGKVIWSLAFGERVGKFHKNFLEFTHIDQVLTVIEVSGLILDVTDLVVKRWIQATQPIGNLIVLEKELLLVRDRLSTSGEAGLLRNSITQILNEIDTNKGIYGPALLDYFLSGQFFNDVKSGDNINTVFGIVAAHAIAHGAAWLGPIYISWTVSWVLTDYLFNFCDVEEQLKWAKYAKDIEALLHEVTYETMRDTINTQRVSGTVLRADVQAFDAGVNFTYRTEQFIWYRIAKAYYSVGAVSKFFSVYGYSSAEEVATDEFLPLSNAAGEYATRWLDAPVVTKTFERTDNAIWNRNAAGLVADFMSIDGISPPLTDQKVQGTVEIEYHFDGTAPPFDIELRADGNLLHSETNILADVDNYFWNSVPYHDGLIHQLELSVTDANAKTMSQSFNVRVGDGINMAPAITITKPAAAGDETFRYYTIEWTDSDPDDEAVISLYYADFSGACSLLESGSSPNWNIIQNWISEDWITDRWVWRNIPVPANGSNQTFYIYGVITDDLHTKCDESGPLLIENVSDANATEAFSIVRAEIDDPPSGYGDSDGVWEPEELVDINIVLTNDTDRTMTDVVAFLSMDTDYSNVLDDDVGYANIESGVEDGGIADFEAIVVPDFSGPLTLRLDIFYRDGGVLKKDIETIDVTVSPQGSGPNFWIASMTYMDHELDKADNDGVPESSEDNIWIDIELGNNGNAEATYVNVVIGSPDDPRARWGRDDRDYPNIGVGQTALPVEPFRLDDIPVDFSGLLTQTMTIYYGPDGTLTDTIEFSVDVQPVPWLKILQPDYNFGLLDPAGQAVHVYQVSNLGTATANISDVTTSDSDLSFSYPSSIAAGTTVDFTATYDPSISSGSVSIPFTIETTNAHSLSKLSGTFSGTVASIPDSNFGHIFSIPWTDFILYEFMLTGDTDGDGNDELIMVRDDQLHDWAVDGYDEFDSKFYLWERTGEDVFTQVYESAYIDGHSSITSDPFSLAVGDVNGDGDDDIFFTGTNRAADEVELPEMYLLTSNGNNSLQIIWSQQVRRWAPTIGDADQDGLGNVVVGFDDQFFVYEWNGSGLTQTNSFTFPALSYVSGNAEVCAIDIYDTDKDGLNEIILSTDDGVVVVYERTGNNAYTYRWNARIANARDDTCVQAVGDVDDDGNIEIAYASTDDGSVYTAEATANNVWSYETTIPLTGAGYNFVISRISGLSSGDINDDGVPEWLVGANASGPEAHFIVLSKDGSSTPDSYVPIYNETTEITMDAYSPSLLQSNTTPEIEVVVPDEENLHIFGTVIPQDASIGDNDIAFSSFPAAENETVTISATVAAIAGDMSNVKVDFYDGDPTVDGILIGTDTIASILSTQTGVATTTYSLSTEGLYSIWTIVDPDNAIDELSEANNMVIVTLVIEDDDTEPPIISDVTLTEQGDGDGLFEDNETIKLAWQVQDDSGVGSSNVEVVGCTVNSPTYSAPEWYVTISACSVADYSYLITVNDGDNSSEQSTKDGNFEVLYHEPQVVSVFPENDSTGLRDTNITITFGTDMVASSINSTTFSVETSGGQPITGQVSYDATLKQATFVPDSFLPGSTQLNVIIDGVLDMNNNTFDTPYIWSFTSGANQPPLPPIAYSPINGSSNTALDITLSWTIGTQPDDDSLTFDVYLGIAGDSFNLLCNNLSTQACTTGLLQENTEYNWYVEVYDGISTVASSVQSFVTAACHSLTMTQAGMGQALSATPIKDIGCLDNEYLAGAEINLSGEPAFRWHVSSWSGTDNDSSTLWTNTLTMPDAPHEVSINYEPTNPLDLNIAVSESSNEIVAGQSVEFQVTVNNLGPNTATNLSFVYYLPTGFTYDYDTVGTCTLNSTTLFCDLDFLFASNMRVFYVGVSTDPADTGGIRTHNFTISSAEYDTNSSNNASGVDVTVNPINDAPELAAIGDQSLDAGDTLVLNLSAFDIDSLTLSFSLNPEAPAFVSLLDNGDGTAVLNIAPAFSDAGTYEATITVSDGELSDSETITISVGEVNQPPTADDQEVSTDEDVALDITLTGSDPDGDELSFNVLTTTTNGVLSGTFPNLTYTPDADFNGDDSFIFEVCDPEPLCDTGTISITVIPVNDAPVAEDDTYDVSNDEKLIVAAPGVLDNDTDIEDDTLSATVVDAPTNGNVILYADGSFSYAPYLDFVGSDTFTYAAFDGVLESNIATATINVLDASVAPVAVGEEYVVNIDGLLTIPASGVLANDTDADGNSLIPILVTDVSNGQLKLRPDGSLQYIPDSGFSGVDSFTYRVSDGGLDSNVVTVIINVVSASYTPQNINLLLNPNFDNGFKNWELINAQIWSVFDGATIYRAQRHATAIIYQSVEAGILAGSPIEAYVDLSNHSSETRLIELRITSLSTYDSISCNVLVPPNAPPQTLTLTGITGTDYSGILFEVVAYAPDEVFVTIDNTGLYWRPDATYTTTECSGF